MKRSSTLALLFLLLSACRTEIAQNLDERAANELQAALLRHGVDAAKVVSSGQRPTWSIQVDRNQAASAARLLAELGLPRARAEGLAEVFGAKGLVPTPLEERARLMHALAGELSRTLEALEGVLLARVHLVLAAPGRAGQAASSPKASALLRVHQSASPKLRRMQDDLRALIAASVEGLSAQDVSVVLEEAPDAPAPSAAPSAGAPRLLPAVLAGLCTGLALAMVGLLAWVRRKGRRTAQALGR